MVQSDTVSEDQQPLMDDSYQGISEELSDEQEPIEESPEPSELLCTFLKHRRRKMFYGGGAKHIILVESTA